MQNEENMAQLLQNVEAMELRMTTAIQAATEGQQEQRLRAEKAEREVKKLTEELKEVAMLGRRNDGPGDERNLGNDGSGDERDLDVMMRPSGSRKGKERQLKDEEYDAGDETDPSEVIFYSLTNLF